MNRIVKWIPVMFLALLLIACDRQDSDSPGSGVTETGAVPPDAQQRSESADEPPMDTDTAAPGETELVAVARAERQQLREQRQADRGWWNDDALAEELGLTPEQRAALQTARQTLLEARLEGRTQLLGQRGSERTAEEIEQAGQLAALQQGRDAVRAEMDEAVKAWHRSVRDILTTEQTERLRERDPHALPAH